MISVIIPVYKVEKYLRKCVESVMNQTYTDLEILLIDDGSPDSCGEICEELARRDSRIRVIHQKNAGLSGARNTGIENSKGEYITFVDSDDYIEAGIYEIMMNAIERNQCDICMCGSVTMSEDGKVLATDRFEDQRIYSGSEIVESFVLPLRTSAWNKIFKAAYIGNVRFPAGRIHGEDLVFMMELMTPNTKLVTVSDIGYDYIKHPGSITTGEFKEKSFDEVYCKDRAVEVIKEKFPMYANRAEVWRFRARMNLIRKIYRASEDTNYCAILHSYSECVNRLYPKIKRYIRFKEKIEFILYKRCNRFYKLLIQ